MGTELLKAGNALVNMYSVTDDAIKSMQPTLDAYNEKNQEVINILDKVKNAEQELADARSAFAGLKVEKTQQEF